MRNSAVRMSSALEACKSRLSRNPIRDSVGSVPRVHLHFSAARQAARRAARQAAIWPAAMSTF
eukprot:415750-Prymnesium_polylepis.1